MKQVVLVICSLSLAFGYLYLPNLKNVRDAKKKVKLESDIIINEDTSTTFDIDGLNQTTGYVTIDKSNGSALFFWYFDSVHTTTPEATVIWLTGGPGCSSETGAFEEYIAPLVVSKDGESAHRQVNSWADNFALLFIDNPIGVGYSTMGNGTSRTSAKESGQDFLVGLKGIKQMHPEWFEIPLYIFGESYAGHYIPQYAYNIMQDGSFPLKGIGIGDGWTDPFNQLTHNADYAYSMGLINLNEWQDIKNLELSGQSSISAGDYLSALDNFEEISTKIVTIAGGVDIYNCRNYIPIDNTNVYTWLNSNDTKDLIGVPREKIWEECNDDIYYEYRYDFMVSYAGLFPELFSNMKVLLYCGADDIIVNCPSWEEFISEIKWGGRDNFLQKDRNPWVVGDQISGYVKAEGNFTQLIVLKAGHMVPMDQQTNSREMLRTFILDIPWNTLQV